MGSRKKEKPILSSVYITYQHIGYLTYFVLPYSHNRFRHPYFQISKGEQREVKNQDLFISVLDSTLTGFHDIIRLLL